MKNEEMIKNSIEYAIQKGSFHRGNWVRTFKNVCVFGLGRYFEEAFVQQDIQERYHVNFLCDNNPEKWGKEFYGLQCISPEELEKLDQCIVIIMVGDSVAVEKQITRMGKPWVIFGEMTFDDIMDIPAENGWLNRAIPDIFRVYDGLSDDKSREVYSMMLSSRINPAYRSGGGVF